MIILMTDITTCKTTGVCRTLSVRQAWMLTNRKGSPGLVDVLNLRLPIGTRPGLKSQVGCTDHCEDTTESVCSDLLPAESPSGSSALIQEGQVASVTLL